VKDRQGKPVEGLPERKAVRRIEGGKLKIVPKACQALRRAEGPPDTEETGEYIGRTGKPGAVKVARPVWSGGKAVRPYLSLQLQNVKGDHR
jgi:hypothetical protein